MRQVFGPGALGRPRGLGWRGRWEGGSGWGIHVTPWLIHVNVRKVMQCCKVISLQLIKINEKKKKYTVVSTTESLHLSVGFLNTELDSSDMTLVVGSQSFSHR